MNLFFENTIKDIIMSDEDEDFENNNICRFCEKKYKLKHS